VQKKVEIFFELIYAQKIFLSLNFFRQKEKDKVGNRTQALRLDSDS